MGLWDCFSNTSVIGLVRSFHLLLETIVNFPVLGFPLRYQEPRCLYPHDPTYVRNPMRPTWTPQWEPKSTKNQFQEVPTHVRILEWIVAGIRAEKKAKTRSGL